MRYSIQRHKELGSESVATEDVSQLVWREGGGGQVDLGSSNLDPIVSLFLSLCRLCMVEKTFISGGLIDILSPQLSSTLVWCLSHVTHPYVHLTEDSYDQVRDLTPLHGVNPLPTGSCLKRRALGFGVNLCTCRC